VIFSIINSLGSSVFSKMHLTLYSLKLAAVSSVLICGAVSLHQHGIYKYSNFTIEKSRDKYARKIDFCRLDKVNYADNEKVWDRDKFSQISVGIYLTSFSYMGFNSLNFIADQIENPRRTLPLAIFLSMPTIVILYMLINFAYFVSMPGTTIINSEIIIHDLYETVIPHGIYKYIFWLAPTAVVIAVGGTLTNKMMTSTRVPIIGAQHNCLPTVFALVSRKHSIPNPSVSFMSFVGSLFILAMTRKSLIAMAAYLDNAFMMASVSSLIYLRFKEPTLARPIKLPLIIPILYVLLNFLLLLTPIITIDDKGSLKKTVPFLAGSGFVIFVGIPLYFLLVRRKSKPSCIVKFNEGLTKVVAKVFDAVPEKVQTIEEKVTNPPISDVDKVDTTNDLTQNNTG